MTERRSGLQRLDPRTKLALGVMAIAGVFIAQRPYTLVAEGVIVFVALPLLGNGKALIRSLRLVWTMVALVFVIAYLSFDTQTALLLSLRLLNLLIVSFIFFHKFGPDELGDALRKMGVPHAFAFILTGGMRYVPLIGRRIRHIMDAQQSRGIDLRPRIRNIPNFMALLMPLLVQSFVLSDELAIAMESRGFSRKDRSWRREYRLTPMEYGVMLSSLVLVIALAWWERG